MKSILRWTAASLAAVFLVSAPQKSYSQVFLGNGTANWSDGTNWVGGVPPAGGAPIAFLDGPLNTTSNNDLPVNTNIAGIFFNNNNPADTTQTNSVFTLNGNKIILGGNIVTAAVAHNGTPTNNRVLRDTINLDMELNAARTITTNQAGTNNVNQTQHHLTINGNITGAFRLNKAGAGILTLNGNNTMNDIQATAGTVQFGSNSSLGLGTIRSSNGTFQYNGVGNTSIQSIDMYNTGNQGVTIAADGVGGGNSTLTILNPFSSTGGNGTTKTITIQGGNGGNNTISTAITNYTTTGGNLIPIQLTKAGTGLWVLTGNNTYTGTTQLNAGNLRATNLNDDLTGASSIGQNTTIRFNGGQLSYLDPTSGNTSIVIANRTMDLIGTGNQAGLFANDSPLTNATITYNGNFAHSVLGTGNKNFTLQGSNTGSNIFNAVIVDNAGANATAGRTNFIKNGTGQWILSGNNTYTGTTTITQGTLSVPYIDDAGGAQPLGLNQTTRLNGGNLNYIGASPVVLGNRVLELSASSQFLNNAAAGDTITYNGGFVYVQSTTEANVTRTLTLGGGNGNATSRNVFNTVLADGAPHLVNGTWQKVLAVAKSNGGTWELTGNNSYSGQTLINQGNLYVSDLGNKGVNSNIGTGAFIEAGNATIRLGNANTSGVLNYTGAGAASDRLFQIGAGTAANNNGGGTINNVGTGALILNGEGGFFNSNNINANSTAQRVLTLGGNFAGVNQINAIIRDNTLLVNGTGTAAVGLTKAGATTWALNGNNTYTGTTAVNGGTLLINGNQSAATGNVTVAAAGTLGGSGVVGGSTTISGNLSPGTSPGLMSFGSNLSLGVNSTFTWELVGNTAAGRGVSFDGVDVAGSLNIDPTSTSNLNSLSGFDINNSFWDSNQQWLVFDTAGNNYAGATFAAIGGNLAGLVAPKGTLGWSVSGGDVYLNYTVNAIPEPTSMLLTVLGIAGVGFRRSRKNRS